MNKKFIISKSLSDMLKFASCLLVAFSHYYSYVVIEKQVGGVIYKAIESLGGYLGVSVFFFLSGYGLMESEQKHHLGIWAFCQRRLSKVYFPALSVTAIWIPIAIYFGKYEYKDVGDLLYTLCWGFKDGALWFIKTILLLYLTFYVFVHDYQKNKYTAHILFIVLICIIYMYNHINIGDWSAISIPMFYLGALLSLNKQNALRGVLAPFTLIAILVCGISFYHGGLSLGGHAFINYIVMIAFTLAIIFTPVGKVEFRFSAFFGALSFDVYLTHNKVLYVLKDTTDFLPVWQWIIVTVIATVLLYTVRKIVFRTTIQN